MTILHAHSDPQFNEHLRSVLCEANGERAVLESLSETALPDGRRVTMTDMVTVNARFANGVLTPLEPIDLPEGALVALNIETSGAPQQDAPKTQGRIVPNHSGFAPGIDPTKLNQLNDELMVEEYLEKERRIRERGE